MPPLAQIKFSWSKQHSPNKLKRNVDLAEKAIDAKIDKIIINAAEELIAIIRSNWSSSSPSKPYDAPAIRTGNLDETVERSRGYGRDSLGRFATKANRKSIRLTFDTRKGGGDRVRKGEGNRLYSGYLEEGTNKMSPRPYLDPAIKELRLKFPGIAVAAGITIDIKPV